MKGEFEPPPASPRGRAHGLQPGQNPHWPPSPPLPVDPLARRESVRIMLLLHSQQQGGQGPFIVTPTVQSELIRLISELNNPKVRRLSVPIPDSYMDFFQRLLDAGYLPLDTA